MNSNLIKTKYKNEISFLINEYFKYQGFPAGYLELLSDLFEKMSNKVEDLTALELEEKALESDMSLSSIETFVDETSSIEEQALMWSLAGDKYTQANSFKEALECYNNSKNLEGNNFVTYYKIAVLHMRIGKNILMESKDSKKYLYDTRLDQYIANSILSHFVKKHPIIQNNKQPITRQEGEEDGFFDEDGKISHDVNKLLGTRDIAYDPTYDNLMDRAVYLKINSAIRNLDLGYQHMLEYQ